MLKHRLIFGAIMIAVLSILLYFDAKTAYICGGQEIQGTIFAVIVGIVSVIAQFEMASLCAIRQCRIFLPVSVLCSVLLALGFFFIQFAKAFNTIPMAALVWIYLGVLSAAVLLSFLYQALWAGTDGTVKNCGATLLAIMYLGFLSSFIMGIRVAFGMPLLLMFIFTVKSSDIGAYTLGRLIGKHKFSPRISPGKTWEGMLGACILAAVIGGVFAHLISEISIAEGLLFGIIFAFLGQLGDLAESMIKRDCGIKDSGSKVPGFGGVLDIIDSPLVCAPAAYLFFYLVL